jgi:subtilisin family serine protease
MKRAFSVVMIVFIVLGVMVTNVSAASNKGAIGLNVVFNTEITDDYLAQLGAFGNVRDVLYEIHAVTLQAKKSDLATIRALPFVSSANPDQKRNGSPVDSVSVTDFSDGLSSWDQDALNVTDFGVGRTIGYDGTGVYVAVLDTGLLDSWRQYFPQERIAEQYGIAFGGGGGEVGSVSSQPEKWQHDQNSHGTHVTSTILGYSLFGNAINGTAPNATIIPVKVLNQNGSGWSSVVARGIVYVADLKASGNLGSSAVVINMSLGGPSLDSMEKAAIDYAITQGVIIVASAGNEGEAGMGYPGAYDPVISVAASGWVGEWTATGSWWRTLDVQDPTAADSFYITDFSSRAVAGQDLDVAAPGSWIVGPYQNNSGQLSYYFLGGTSMASPHVAGIVALMVQKNPGLSATDVENILTGSAIPLPAGCRVITDPSLGPTNICWGDDASGAGMVTADASLAATP